MTTTISGTTRSPAAVSTRPRVPWSTLLPLAIVLAYADGFWMIVLRETVGSIQRTGAPFVTWLRESTLSIPIFVVAVLGALTLALRWFGPRPRGKGLLGTVLLITGAGTIASTALIAASSAYDYELQKAQLVVMSTMHGPCLNGGCTEALDQASLHTQLKAVALGFGLVLLTNLVFVAWVLAFKGGRFETARRETADANPRVNSVFDLRDRTSRADDLRLVLIGGLIASSVVHLAMVPEYFKAWTVGGIFMLALAAAQVAVAAGVIVRAREAVVLAAIVTIAPALLWVVSRTIGLPFGPESGFPHALGLADGAAVVLELATFTAAILLIRTSTRLRNLAPASAHVSWIVAFVVISLTIVGVAGSNLGWFNVTAPPAPQFLFTHTH